MGVEVEDDEEEVRASRKKRRTATRFRPRSCRAYRPQRRERASFLHYPCYHDACRSEEGPRALRAGGRRLRAC